MTSTRPIIRGGRFLQTMVEGVRHPKSAGSVVSRRRHEPHHDFSKCPQASCLNRRDSDRRRHTGIDHHQTLRDLNFSPISARCREFRAKGLAQVEKTVANQTIPQLQAQKMRAGKLDSRQLTLYYLARIQNYDEYLGAGQSTLRRWKNPGGGLACAWGWSSPGMHRIPVKLAGQYRNHPAHAHHRRGRDFAQSRARQRCPGGNRTAPPGCGRARQSQPI